MSRNVDGRRVLVCIVVFLLMGAAWTLASPASQVPGYKVPQNGQYHYVTELLSTQPQVDAAVDLASPAVAVYLNPVKSLAGIALPNDIAGVKPIAGVQVFDYRPALNLLITKAQPKEPALTELTQFSGKMIVTLTYATGAPLPGAMTLLVATGGKVQYVILTASSGYPTSGPFTILSTQFDSKANTVQIVVGGWPVGDPIICAGP